MAQASAAAGRGVNGRFSPLGPAEAVAARLSTRRSTRRASLRHRPPLKELVQVLAPDERLPELVAGRDDHARAEADHPPRRRVANAELTSDPCGVVEARAAAALSAADLVHLRSAPRPPRPRKRRLSAPVRAQVRPSPLLDLREIPEPVSRDELAWNNRAVIEPHDGLTDRIREVAALAGPPLDRARRDAEPLGDAVDISEIARHAC